MPLNRYITKTSQLINDRSISENILQQAISLEGHVTPIRYPAPPTTLPLTCHVTKRCSDVRGNACSSSAG